MKKSGKASSQAAQEFVSKCGLSIGDSLKLLNIDCDESNQNDRSSITAFKSVDCDLASLAIKAKKRYSERRIKILVEIGKYYESNVDKFDDILPLWCNIYCEHSMDISVGCRSQIQKINLFIIESATKSQLKLIFKGIHVHWILCQFDSDVEARDYARKSFLYCFPVSEKYNNALTMITRVIGEKLVNYFSNPKPDLFFHGCTENVEYCDFTLHTKRRQLILSMVYEFYTQPLDYENKIQPLSLFLQQTTNKECIKKIFHQDNYIASDVFLKLLLFHVSSRNISDGLSESKGFTIDDFTVLMTNIIDEKSVMESRSLTLNFVGVFLSFLNLHKNQTQTIASNKQIWKVFLTWIKNYLPATNDMSVINHFVDLLAILMVNDNDEKLSNCIKILSLVRQNMIAAFRSNPSTEKVYVLSTFLGSLIFKYFSILFQSSTSVFSKTSLQIMKLEMMNISSLLLDLIKNPDFHRSVIKFLECMHSRQIPTEFTDFHSISETVLQKIKVYFDDLIDKFSQESKEILTSREFFCQFSCSGWIHNFQTLENFFHDTISKIMSKIFQTKDIDVQMQLSLFVINYFESHKQESCLKLFPIPKNNDSDVSANQIISFLNEIWIKEKSELCWFHFEVIFRVIDATLDNVVSVECLRETLEKFVNLDNYFSVLAHLSTRSKLYLLSFEFLETTWNNNSSTLTQKYVNQHMTHLRTISEILKDITLYNCTKKILFDLLDQMKHYFLQNPSLMEYSGIFSSLAKAGNKSIRYEFALRAVCSILPIHFYHSSDIHSIIQDTVDILGSFTDKNAHSTLLKCILDVFEYYGRSSIDLDPTNGHGSSSLKHIMVQNRHHVIGYLWNCLDRITITQEEYQSLTNSLIEVLFENYQEFKQCIQSLNNSRINSWILQAFDEIPLVSTAAAIEISPVDDSIIECSILLFIHDLFHQTVAKIREYVDRCGGRYATFLPSEFLFYQIVLKKFHSQTSEDHDYLIEVFPTLMDSQNIELLSNTIHYCMKLYVDQCNILAGLVYTDICKHAGEKNFSLDVILPLVAGQVGVVELFPEIMTEDWLKSHINSSACKRDIFLITLFYSPNIYESNSWLQFIRIVSELTSKSSQIQGNDDFASLLERVCQLWCIAINALLARNVSFDKWASFVASGYPVIINLYRKISKNEEISPRTDGKILETLLCCVLNFLVFSIIGCVNNSNLENKLDSLFADREIFSSNSNNETTVAILVKALNYVHDKNDGKCKDFGHSFVFQHSIKLLWIISLPFFAQSRNGDAATFLSNLPPSFRFTKFAKILMNHTFSSSTKWELLQDFIVLAIYRFIRTYLSSEHRFETSFEHHVLACQIISKLDSSFLLRVFSSQSRSPSLEILSIVCDIFRSEISHKNVQSACFKYCSLYQLLQSMECNFDEAFQILFPLSTDEQNESIGMENFKILNTSLRKSVKYLLPWFHESDDPNAGSIHCAILQIQTLIILRLIQKCPRELQKSFISHVITIDKTMFDILFALMDYFDLDRFLSLSKAFKNPSIFDFPFNDHMAIRLIPQTILECFETIDYIVVDWFENNCSIKDADKIRKLLQSYLSRIFVSKQLARCCQEVNFPQLKLTSINVTGELKIEYAIENEKIILFLSFGPLYPLANQINVRVDQKASQSIPKEWKRIFAKLKTLLSLHKFNITTALFNWLSSTRREIAASDICVICQSIFHPTNRSLPKHSCSVCRQKYHHPCLNEWFATSGKNTCPNCVSAFR